MSDDDVRGRYGELADVYIEMFGAAEHVAPEDLEFLERHLGGGDGPVLDAGCGPGHLTAHLAGLGRTVKGIDLVPEFIAHAQSTWPLIEFAVGSLQSLDVPDGSQAGILAWYSLIHCAPGDLAHVLKESRRAIARGGTLVIGFFDGSAVEAFDHKVITAYRWPADEMSRMLSVAGFAEIDRSQRAGTAAARPHAAIAARAV